MAGISANTGGPFLSEQAQRLLMDGNELFDISGTGLGCILADMYESKTERPSARTAAAGRVN
jgi:hypothetical protein